MGIDMTDDTRVDYSNYLNAVTDILVIFQKRFKIPWLYFNFTFQRCVLKKTQDKYIEILHDMSNEVIFSLTLALPEVLNITHLTFIISNLISSYFAII